MASGTIRFVNDRRPTGVVGFAIDDALAECGDEWHVRFDSRCLATPQTIQIGDRVEFQYDTRLSKRLKPRMRFGSMKIISKEGK
jgi:hypothetical protein